MSLTADFRPLTTGLVLKLRKPGRIPVLTTGWGIHIATKRSVDTVTPRFRSILQFLASAPDSPEVIPGLSIPQRSDQLPHEYREGENSLVSMAMTYGDLLQPFLASDDNTLPPDESILEEIDALLGFMLGSNDPILWIWAGFVKTAAWKSVRRLAGIALEKLDWPTSTLTADELTLVLE